MPSAMNNSIEVPYTWKIIYLKEYEQYEHQDQKPLYDMNENCEVVSPPRRVLKPWPLFDP
jgi:hypothetical protein